MKSDGFRTDELSLPMSQLKVSFWVIIPLKITGSLRFKNCFYCGFSQAPALLAQRTDVVRA